MHDAFLCEVCICKYFVRMLNLGGIKFTNISENKVLLNNEPKAHWEAYNNGWQPSSVVVISFISFSESTEPIKVKGHVDSLFE